MVENSLIKQVGIAGIFVLAGFLIWILSKIGSLNLSLGDIAFIIVLVSGGGYIGYCVISYFTGAKVTDVGNVQDIINKLLDILKGEESSDSQESNST